MKIKNAHFIISNSDYKLCPKKNIPEYAFIGRSNVGKSSLINLITNKKQLAKTSSKPGKTQLINHFLINNDWYLVDLPGYGYASVSKHKKNILKEMTWNYLRYRQNLMCLFVLLDSRHKPQNIDLEFMTFLGKEKIPFVMIFTKTDKINKNLLNKNIQNYKKMMLQKWVEMPNTFSTSVTQRNGAKEILEFIKRTNTLF